MFNYYVVYSCIQTTCIRLNNVYTFVTLLLILLFTNVNIRLFTFVTLKITHIR